MSTFITFRWLIALLAASFASGELVLGKDPRAAEDRAANERIRELLEQLFQNVDEEALSQPPLRDYKIEKGPVQQAKLFRADPKLLENKFVASIFLKIASVDDAASRNRNRYPVDFRQTELYQAVHDLPDGIKRLMDGRTGRSIFTGINMNIDASNPAIRRMNAKSVSKDDAIPTLSGFFKLLSELSPKDQLPPQAALDYLASADCDRDVKWKLAFGPSEPNGPSERNGWIVNVYAPSEELAAERARSILQLFDNGLCRPLQRDCLHEGKSSLEAAQQGYAESAELTKAIAAKEAELANPSEITPDILTQLKAQKVMVSVEMAGLSARVKACNEMLKQARDDTRPPSPLQNSIGDMKVRAEVELVGTKEKLDRINALIAEGNSREALREQIRQLASAQSALQRRIGSHQRRAESYIHLVSLYAPLQLMDNQITVSPIEWTN